MESMLVLSTGAVGAAVAEAFERIVRDCASDVDVERVESNPRKWTKDLLSRPLKTTYVVVAGYPDALMLSSIGRSARRWRARMLPITLDHGEAIVGPVDGVGSLGCASCFDRRRLQHHRHADTVKVLRQSFLAAPDEFPERGHLHSTVRATAAVAVDLLQSSSSDGTYLSVGFSPVVVRSGRMTPVHGCAHCSASDEANRSWLRLGTHVAALLDEPHRKGEVA